LRTRPYHLEPRLQPLAIMQSPSFASGHTLWAYLQAFLWSELRPDQRSQFLALAEEIRQSREIMGIHFPSDNETARVLAHQMLSLMAKNKKFQADLIAAKEEWEK
jgi:acid phosphatase (class A)